MSVSVCHRIAPVLCDCDRIGVIAPVFVSRECATVGESRLVSGVRYHRPAFQSSTRSPASVAPRAPSSSILAALRCAVARALCPRSCLRLTPSGLLVCSQKATKSLKIMGNSFSRVTEEPGRGSNSDALPHEAPSQDARVASSTCSKSRLGNSEHAFVHKLSPKASTRVQKQAPSPGQTEAPVVWTGAQPVQSGVAGLGIKGPQHRAKARY